MNTEEYERMHSLEDRHWWFIARRRLIASLLADRSLPNNIDILDIGCGTGAMLDQLEAYGSVVGADFSTEALSFCHKRSDATGKTHPLVRADIRSLPFQDGSFDVVTAMDIIEHIDRDKDASLEILRVLKPGGCLIATVPAFMSLWSSHDVALHHHRRYTAPQFKDLLQRSGFQIEKLSYTVTSVFPLVWLVRIMNRLFHSSSSVPHADVVETPKIANSLLLSLMNAETEIVRKSSLPFGVTIVAVARKASA
jgi:ubiquinone/menaquinone biosynthesis C-methylase UbiE